MTATCLSPATRRGSRTRTCSQRLVGLATGHEGEADDNYGADWIWDHASSSIAVFIDHRFERSNQGVTLSRQGHDSHARRNPVLTRLGPVRNQSSDPRCLLGPETADLHQCAFVGCDDSFDRTELDQ